MSPEEARALRHDFRTPVNHLVGYAELLLEEDGINEELSRQLKEVHALAERCLAAINGLLEADSSVASTALEALDSEVATLEGATAGLRASHPAHESDLGRIEQAVARLRELVEGRAGAAAEPGVASALDPALDSSTQEVILVVDDDEANREVLVRRLQRLHHATTEAANGREALATLRQRPISLVLLDVMMPEVDGFQVLEKMKANPDLRHVPVIMISAVDETESIVRCIEQGAEDYLPKPFDPVLLKARVGASLEKKRLRDSERELLAAVSRQADELRRWNEDLERRVAEQVAEVERLGRLRRFVAPQVAEAIASGGEALLKSHRREITALFCDLRGFTSFSETSDPEDVMTVLREFHGQVGPLIFELEGTLAQFSGDGMLVFFNDPVPCDDPAWRAVKLALEMQRRAARMTQDWSLRGHDLGLGVGIAMGHATCGPIGFEGRFEYTAIGPPLNLAARLCAAATPGQVLATERVVTAVGDRAGAELVGELELKGLSRPVRTFALSVQAEPPN